MPHTTDHYEDGSDKTRAIQTPIIPTINRMVREHTGTISLGQGIAYYGPPQEAFAAIEKKLNTPEVNWYGPTKGIDELHEALKTKLATKNKIIIDNNNAIFVTAGSNMAFSSLALAITDPGDEIILLTPYYFNHETAIRMATANPVLVPTLSNYHPDIDAIEAAITSKTRAIVTVSPNNPTGAVYSQEELKAINALCVARGIYHISDEAYEDFVHAGHQHYSPAAFGDPEHTISLFSFSKAYGFAGWRIGYMVIPEKLFTAITKIQDTVLISPPIISQYAAIGALQAPQSYIDEKLAEITKSRTVCLELLNQLQPLIATPSAEGAFYIFIKLNTDKDDLSIAKQLITEYQIATIPGCAFEPGAGAYLRLSYGALTETTVAAGIKKLVTGLQTLVS